jgi:hypothetical protein
MLFLYGSLGAAVSGVGVAKTLFNIEREYPHVTNMIKSSIAPAIFSTIAISFTMSVNSQINPQNTPFLMNPGKHALPLFACVSIFTPAAVALSELLLTCTGVTNGGFLTPAIVPGPIAAAPGPVAAPQN